MISDGGRRADGSNVVATASVAAAAAAIAAPVAPAAAVPAAALESAERYVPQVADAEQLLEEIDACGVSARELILCTTGRHLCRRRVAGGCAVGGLRSVYHAAGDPNIQLRISAPAPSQTLAARPRPSVLCPIAPDAPARHQPLVVVSDMLPAAFTPM